MVTGNQDDRKISFLASQFDFLNCVYLHFSLAGMEQNSASLYMKRLGKIGENHAANSVTSNFWVPFFNSFVFVVLCGKEYGGQEYAPTLNGQICIKFKLHIFYLLCFFASNVTHK